ncbi:hypothetical protein CcCBS67573_g01874 [Chytriomyces confervae]|uniref:Mannosyltransferase n=1 Tax=Chytriomyces confervae TaxID=246404 RepID=A0A507FK97_9FUNG|nr:hypothetical protein CcCBS67573_g01874 [Chytriomyces confervae]
MNTKQAFLILLLCRTLSALYYHVITDCDEVFNYWEPSHFVAFGTGFQTWEYSPQFNIRSWLYAGIHAVASVVCAGVLQLSKVSTFYTIRVLFAVTSAAAEAKLYAAVKRANSAECANWMLLFLAASTGMTAASTAYLPSSFSMYLVTLAFAHSLDGAPSNRRTWMFVFLIAASVIVGWPFSGAMALPFLFEDLIAMGSTGTQSTRVSRFLAAVSAGLSALAGLLGPTLIVDRIYYGFWSVVPLNIVLYNVFSGSGEGKGPDIFGTEPWWFYVANGALNFNIAFVACLLSVPCLLISRLIMGVSKTHQNLQLWKQINRLLPFYLWFAIFSTQPHKEERFLFVVYPIVCYNAAIAISSVLQMLDWILSGRKLKKSKFAPSKSKRMLVRSAELIIATVFVTISVSRTIAMVENYGAPIQVYTHASNHLAVLNQSTRLCIGKEWYRFPSHYFIPSNVEVRFIRSEFRGLLPAKFGDSVDESLTSPLKTWEVTRVNPRNLNEFNKEDETRYVAVDTCDYLIDSDFGPVDNEAVKAAMNSNDNKSLERRFILDTRAWETVVCQQFLDSGKSQGLFGKVLWAPSYLGMKKGQKWGRYCMLKKVHK